MTREEVIATVGGELGDYTSGRSLAWMLRGIWHGPPGGEEMWAGEDATLTVLFGGDGRADEVKVGEPDLLDQPPLLDRLCAGSASDRSVGGPLPKAGHRARWLGTGQSHAQAVPERQAERGPDEAPQEDVRVERRRVGRDPDEGPPGERADERAEAGPDGQAHECEPGGAGRPASPGRRPPVPVRRTARGRTGRTGRRPGRRPGSGGTSRAGLRRGRAVATSLEHLPAGPQTTRPAGEGGPRLVGTGRRERKRCAGDSQTWGGAIGKRDGPGVTPGPL